jgi:hypothetical protein
VREGGFCLRPVDYLEHSWNALWASWPAVFTAGNQQLLELLPEITVDRSGRSFLVIMYRIQSDKSLAPTNLNFYLNL